MVKINFLVTALAALVPIVIGSIWYNPRFLGKAWIKATGLCEEELRKANNFRTFKHGMLHGIIAAIFMAMPVLSVLALFERKSGKYIMIHTGFWILSMMLMGGIICQFT